MKIKVFVSYSHRDASYLADDSLLGFIRGLEQDGVEFWWDHSLVAGDNWDEEIRSRIRDSHIALVLISQWFLDSAYCMKTEVSGFIEKCREGGLIIFPIILSPCEWERHDWLRTRQFLPGGGETIEEHYVDAGSRKKLFLQIRQQLRKQVDKARGGAADDSAHRIIDNSTGVTTSQPISHIESLAKNVSYDNPVKARKNILAIKAYVLTLDSPDANEKAIMLMKNVLFESVDGNPIPGNIRQVRQDVLSCIKALKTRDLCFYFQHGELEGLDLFGMDFSSEDLRGVSFKKAFLIEASFEGAVLEGADFSYSRLRNVNFTDARLTRARLTEADWFNALGLTRAQLESVKKDTLRSLPRDVAGFHEVLKQKYVLPFESWEKHIQDQLTSTWKEYLRSQPPLDRKADFLPQPADHHSARTAGDSTTLDPDHAGKPSPAADQSLQAPSGADQPPKLSSNGKPDPPIELKSRHLASWLLGSLLLIFFLYVFLFSPDTLPEYKQRMLAFACALIAGLFSFFLTGDIGLEVKSARSRFGTISIKATAGFAAFVLMLLWWFSPLAPVKPGVDPPLRPEPNQITIYRLRVTVLNPQQAPVSDADVYSSTSGERKRVDGGWEIDIPATSKPADGKITVYASKPAASLYGQQEFVLDKDANPTVRIQLRVGEPPIVERLPPSPPDNGNGSSTKPPSSISSYRVRVTLLDTERTVVEEAEIHSMPPGVVKKVGGGWEIEIPASNKPNDGALKIYASKPSAFLKAAKVLRLDKDSNPTVEIQLRKDASAPMSGWIKDSSGQGIAGALAYECEFRGEAVRTGPDGKFDLSAHKAKSQMVKMCAEKEGYITKTQYHPAGGIPMTITLSRGQQ